MQMSPLLFYGTLLLPCIYYQALDDIVNGTYDSTKDIPGTYSDAWEQTLSDAWDNIVEQSSDAIPGESDTNTSTEGGNTEEPPEGDGDDNNNSNNEDNNDQKDPPEGARFTEEEIQEILNDIKGDGFKNNPLRQAYEEEVRALKELGEALLESGQSLEEVARTLWQARRDLGIEYKNMTPELLREFIYEINQGRYGDPLGPSFEYLINMKGKSFQDIIDSASTPNSDIDELLKDFEEWLRRQ